MSFLRWQGIGSMIIIRKLSLLLESQVVESTFSKMGKEVYLKWRSAHVTFFTKHLSLHPVMFSQSSAPSFAMEWLWWPSFSSSLSSSSAPLNPSYASIKLNYMQTFQQCLARSWSHLFHIWYFLGQRHSSFGSWASNCYSLSILSSSIILLGHMSMQFSLPPYSIL